MICSMPGQGGGLKLKELLGKLVLWQWFCKNCSFRVSGACFIELSPMNSESLWSLKAS